MISTRINFPRAYLTASRSITAPSLIFAQTAGNNKISTFSGGSLIVIEHNLDVSKTAYYLIDLGPEGGHLVATGTPEDIMAVKESHTGRFLRTHLANTNGKRETAA